MDKIKEKFFIFFDFPPKAKFYGMTGLSGNLIILTVLYYGGNLVTSDVLTVGMAFLSLKSSM